MPRLAEYVWLDAKNGFRSKIRVLPGSHKPPFGVPATESIPMWNYDGSSTGQASTASSEVTIVPRFACENPFLGGQLVLCDTYDVDGAPTKSNTRDAAARIFEKVKSDRPWYGFEQEYFLSTTPLAGDHHPVWLAAQGQSYCGIGRGHIYGRAVAEEHLQKCLAAGLTVSGINAEVALGQWEFQIGPVEGIQAADQLLVARYLLEKVAERTTSISSGIRSHSRKPTAADATPTSPQRRPGKAPGPPAGYR